ncbi:hypothetical protein Q6D67_20860 [Haliea sp. E1-2-M8]|uniref:hypothetical protein n=1 Tax=Haliea sp. E1-2-M8 TaxID=3064706 RepID=UPI002728DE41|nr:hypothetical protein [Haliea sp. E1-2-M8]MDO8864141.1 hypothetical protein [Haliea sp. E1-2-M8]
MTKTQVVKTKVAKNETNPQTKENQSMKHSKNSYAVEIPKKGRAKLRMGMAPPKQRPNEKLDDNFDFATWQQRLNESENDTQTFELWREGVAISELAFSNYQLALLKVLQNVYAFYYDTQKQMRATRDITKDSIKRVLGEKVARKTGSMENQLVRIAWLKHEEAADDAGKRALQKRMSTYAGAVRNAWTPGEIVEGVTDSDGRILPEKFAEVVKSNGGVSVFSRKSREQLAREQEIKGLLLEAGCENENEMHAKLVKQAIVEGTFTDDTVDLATGLEISVNLLHYEVSEQISKDVDIADGEIAVLLVSNTDGKKLVRSVLTSEKHADAVDGLLLHEHHRLRTELKEAVKAELDKHKKNVLKGDKKKYYVNGVDFSQAELERLEKMRSKASQVGLKGNLNELLDAMLDSHCEGKTRTTKTM